MSAECGPVSRIAVIGAGKIGRWIARSLSSFRYDLTVFDVDTHALAKEEWKEIGANTVLLEDGLDDEILAVLRQCSQVFLSVPENPGEELFSALLDRLGSKSVLIDTFSVKTPVAEIYRNSDSDTVAFGINPLFRPDPGLTGPMLICRYGDSSPDTCHLFFILKANDIFECEAEIHDRITSVFQGGLHSVVIAYASLLESSFAKIERNKPLLGTPPSKIMHALCSRVLSGQASTYLATIRGNPHVRENVRVLCDAMDHLQAMKEEEFVCLYDRLASSLHSDEITTLSDSLVKATLEETPIGV